ncbi:M20/M25/M40 family metallo-hydrolase [Aliterella atlantica]|uniref:Peptidase M28 n=1 Tax=Aliterella atlantica CENA595 TaxID=1618023 RepID=A0A0D8ZX05_9CYAN|nr:M20/M25/M40 family metallo-hydrolase [Aliterella atlantica]KJH72979.1 peptidase M28 [Aliterella atlantica CENA595]
MRRLILLVLLIVVGVSAVISNRFFARPPAPAQPQIVETPKAIPQRQNAPKVAANKLFERVQQLSFERYTQSDRDRARKYITQSLENLGWSPTLQTFAEGVNIVAERSGKDPQAGTILVAAHYDTVPGSPGADDNASGVATMLEIARIFRLPTRQTLKLAFFDAEEIGLRGSLAFAADKANLENLQGVVVMDMIGFACYSAGCQKYPPSLPVAAPSDKGDFLVVVGDAEHLSLLNAFAHRGEKLPMVLTLPVPLKGIFTPDVLRSDHAPFWYQGIGAVLVTDTANLRSPFYHQPSDTFGEIEQDFFKGAAQVVVDAVEELLEESPS